MGSVNAISRQSKPVLAMNAFISGRSQEPPDNPAQRLKIFRDHKELVFEVKPGKIGMELQENANH